MSKVSLIIMHRISIRTRLLRLGSRLYLLLLFRGGIMRGLWLLARWICLVMNSILRVNLRTKDLLQSSSNGILVKVVLSAIEIFTIIRFIPSLLFQ